jgi:hypothetical protein
MPFPDCLDRTAAGDPNQEFARRRKCPLQITNDDKPVGDFDLLNKLLGMNALSYGIYTTARQNCSYVLEYDETLQNLKAIGACFTNSLLSAVCSRSMP